MIIYIDTYKLKLSNSLYLDYEFVSIKSIMNNKTFLNF